MINKRIKELQQEIILEQQRIDSCSHSFGDAYSNPTTELEAYGMVGEGQGSDYRLVPAGYRKVEKARWTRICTKCGAEQHTTKQEPVISEYKPKF